MNSAIRRHHYKRLQKARANHWLVWGLEPYTLTARQRGMVVATPHPCSRACCGNPRKYFNEKTMQERRNFQNDCPS